MKDLLEKINKWLLVILILLQPIVDIIKNVVIHDIQILGFSLFEMINIVLVLASLIITIYLYKDKNKFIKYILILGLFILYSIFHYINILKFDSNLYENYNPNYLVETYYLFRTFMISLILIINIYYSNIKKQSIIRIIEALSLIISLFIIIPNIFKFGYLSYGEGICNLNLFDWFSFESVDAYSYYNLTCKGLFSSANQISSILFMLFPIILYLSYRKNCLFNYIVLLFQGLAMFMLGTKTANLGMMLIYIGFILFYFVLKLLKKTNHSLMINLIIFIGFSGLFFFSPFYHNLKFNLNGSSTFQKFESNEETLNNADDKSVTAYNKYLKIKTFDCDCLSTDQETLIKDFLDNDKSYLGISSYITDNYKIEKHPKFWCNFIKYYSGSNYRNLKNNILKNIYIENNNPADKFFGLGYSLNYIYTETDYYYQFYSYGILGMLLFIFPYFAILFYIGILILKNIKTKFNLENCMYLLGIILSLGIAYFSGHVLERTFPLLMTSLLVSLNLINIKKENYYSNKILLISDGNESMKFAKNLKDSDYRIFVGENFKYKKSYLNFGKKAKYIKINKNKEISLVLYIYNLFKILFTYVVFNPKSIIIFDTKMYKVVYYIGKFFGSKIICFNDILNKYDIDYKLEKKELLESKYNSNYVEKIENITKEKKKNNLEKIHNYVKKNKDILIIIAIMFFLLVFCCFNSFIINDDLPYSFFHRTSQRVTNIKQVIGNQIADYKNINSRVFVHSIVQIMLIQGKSIWNFLNPLAIVLSLILVVKISQLYTNKNDKKIALLISCILFLLLIQYKKIIFWVAGSVNYVWTGLYLLFLIYLYLKKGFSKNIIINSLIILSASILHEMLLVFSIIFILLNYIGDLIKNKKIVNKNLFYFIPLVISYIFLLKAPATVNRLLIDSAWNELSILEKVMKSTPIVSARFLILFNINNLIPTFFVILLFIVIFRSNMKHKSIYCILTFVVSLLSYFFGGWFYFVLACIIFVLTVLYNHYKNRDKLSIIFISLYSVVYSMILTSEFSNGRPNYLAYLGMIIIIIIMIHDIINLKYEKIIVFLLSIIFGVLILCDFNNYFTIGKISKERQREIRLCAESNCEILYYKKIPNKYENYHMDINSPQGNNYFAYKHFINYYKLPKDAIIKYYK